MKPIKTILLLTMLFAASFGLHAQKASDAGAQKNNIVKFNLTNLFLKTFTIQYERVLNKRSGVALSVNVMPSTGLPLKSVLLSSTDDAKSKKVINDMTLSSFALAPEYRFYVGRQGYGRGFYLAPFYRFSTNTVRLLPVTYTRDGGGENTIDLSGNFSTHTGGLMIGAQWFLGKSITLDWWVIGPHYGGGSGTFTGASKETLSADERHSIEETVNNIDIPLIKKSVETSPAGAVLKASGAWGGARFGLCFGFRF